MADGKTCGDRGLVGTRATADLFKCATSVLALSLAIGTASQAHAEANQPATPPSVTPDSKHAGLQEIVGTALRRSESLQKTPVAASVLDQAALSRKSVTTISDLQNATPSLSVTNTGVVSNVNIRGIGLSSNSPQVVPGIASYRDGIWQPPVGSASTFYDIASVEVLRGPQGTFVGSNSTGGAIFINTKNPDLDGVHGRIEGLVANYRDLGLNGAINLPVDSRLAVRVAFNGERRNSFFTNVASQAITPTGGSFNTPGALDEKDGRVSVLWKPTTTLQIVAKTDYVDRSTGGYAMKPIPTTAYAPYAPADPFTLNFDQITKADEKASRNSVEIKWQPSPGGVTFRSLTGYQSIIIRNIYDVDATNSTLPGPPAQADYEAINEKTFSEELNILSPTGGAFEWIAGAYHSYDTRKVGHDITSQAFPPNVLINFYTQLKAEAVFGQASYKLFPKLQVQVGGRFTHNSITNPPGGYINIGPGAALIDASGSHKDDVFTGKVALNWQANQDNFLYAFAAKGFKGGGFRLGNAGQFSPEVVWDYEIGWKSSLFNRHLRTRIGGFYNDYKNLQVAVIDTASGANNLTNIGKSTIKGVEAQVDAYLGGFRIDAGGAYVDSKLGAVSLVNTRLIPGGGAINLGPQCSASAAPPACFDYTPFIVNVNGRANPYSPKWTFNAGAEYTFKIGESVTVTPRVNYSYVGKQYTTLIEAPITDVLRSFGLLNALVTVETGRWRIQGYATNLTNKVYIQGQYNNAQTYGNPRQFGVRVSREF